MPGALGKGGEAKVVLEHPFSWAIEGLLVIDVACEFYFTYN
jgi:hypothetical protein